MTDQTEKIAQFRAITGSDEEKAKFYLSSAANKIEVSIYIFFIFHSFLNLIIFYYYQLALTNYFENADEFNDISEIVTDVPQQSETSPSSVPADKPKSTSKSSNFATINTLTTSSDEEEGQAYYAGGSEHSGQQVLGPPKKRDIVADMFKSVQE